MGILIGNQCRPAATKPVRPGNGLLTQTSSHLDLHHVVFRRTRGEGDREKGRGKKKIKKYRVERSTFSTPISPLLFFPLPPPLSFLPDLWRSKNDSDLGQPRNRLTYRESVRKIPRPGKGGREIFSPSRTITFDLLFRPSPPSPLPFHEIARLTRLSGRRKRRGEGYYSAKGSGKEYRAKICGREVVPRLRVERVLIASRGPWKIGGGRSAGVRSGK